MEKSHSESKIRKSEPETSNSNVNTVNFISYWEGSNHVNIVIIISPLEHAIANVCLTNICAFSLDLLNTIFLLLNVVTGTLGQLID